MQPDHDRVSSRACTAGTCRRRALRRLLGGALGLLGTQYFQADAARGRQEKCTKIKNKKRRKQCGKKTKAHRDQDTRQLPTPTSNPPGSNVRLPVRAAFYYPWFPNAWKQGSFSPYTNYEPSLGYYDGGDPAVIGQQIAAMQYGGIQVGIASWWGVGHHTDARIPALLSAAAGTGFRWALYYEAEGSANPSVDQIRADLTSIRDRYASDPSYARIDGKFVLFVYNANDGDCAVADRWQQANTVGAYIVLKVFAGYRTCAKQPQSWHQYAPVVAADHQAGYSYAISPGFWQKGQEVRLARDLARWEQNVRDMVASGAPWQLVTTFNEWGEGTSVESAVKWASPSGYGVYLDALHRNGQP
jgi:hypothetical protein